jgi:hypothetical protein
MLNTRNAVPRCLNSSPWYTAFLIEDICEFPLLQTLEQGVREATLETPDVDEEHLFAQLSA